MQTLYYNLLFHRSLKAQHVSSGIPLIIRSSNCICSLWFTYAYGGIINSKKKKKNLVSSARNRNSDRPACKPSYYTDYTTLPHWTYNRFCEQRDTDQASRNNNKNRIGCFHKMRRTWQAEELRISKHELCYMKLPHSLQQSFNSPLRSRCVVHLPWTNKIWLKLTHYVYSNTNHKIFYSLLRPKPHISHYGLRSWHERQALMYVIHATWLIRMNMEGPPMP